MEHGESARDDGLGPQFEGTRKENAELRGYDSNSTELQTKRSAQAHYENKYNSKPGFSTAQSIRDNDYE